MVGDTVGSVVGSRVGIEVDMHDGYTDNTLVGDMVGSPGFGVGRYDG